jgi:hypothetical protein
MKTTAQQLLNKANTLMEQRGKQYDANEGERSMLATVTAFNAITRRNLTESEGFLLLAVLKMVRDNQRKQPHQDSIEDLVAYASLYGEARLGEGGGA